MSWTLSFQYEVGVLRIGFSPDEMLAFVRPL